MSGRGKGHNQGAASNPPRGDSSARNYQKVMKALKLAHNSQTALRRSRDGFGSEGNFVQHWAADPDKQDPDIAAFERFYERIINAWQDEIFDVLERELASRNELPKPPSSNHPDEQRRWSEEAVELGLVGPPPSADAPGRWARQVLAGVLEEADRENLYRFVEYRQLFAHKYTELEDAQHAHVIWKRAGQLDDFVPVIADRVEKVIDRLWPDA